jgi:inner membrane transporter RhtA
VTDRPAVPPWTLAVAAIERIPLGTSVAVEFLGSPTVAAVRSHTRRALAWPALALAGVVLLTQLLGDRFSGLSGLSMTVPVAALTAALVGVPQATGHPSLHIVAAAAGLALLLPVLPYALELLALRRMTHHAFGTLMALEPAIGVLLGLLVLHRAPSLVQVSGIALVVLAGAAAQRVDQRQPEGPHRSPVQSQLDVLGLTGLVRQLKSSPLRWCQDCTFLPR